METIEHVLQYGPHTKQNFDIIYASRNTIPNQQETVKCWLYGMSVSHPDFITEDMITEIDNCKREATKVLKNIQRQKPILDVPSALDLDCIWMLWFATNDNIYPEMVRKIALRIPVPYAGAIRTSVDPVKSDAKWSYEGIMKTSISRS